MKILNNLFNYYFTLFCFLQHMYSIINLNVHMIVFLIMNEYNYHNYISFFLNLFYMSHL